MRGEERRPSLSTSTSPSLPAGPHSCLHRLVDFPPHFPGGLLSHFRLPSRHTFSLLTRQFLTYWVRHWVESWVKHFSSLTVSHCSSSSDWRARYSEHSEPPSTRGSPPPPPLLTLKSLVGGKKPAVFWYVGGCWRLPRPSQWASPDSCCSWMRIIILVGDLWVGTGDWPGPARGGRGRSSYYCGGGGAGLTEPCQVITEHRGGRAGETNYWTFQQLFK